MIRRILNKIESIYYFRYFANVKNGATNTLLKKIYKSTDVLFLEKVFQLDFFREIVEPVELELNNQEEILVLAPHQDDELIGLGGTLISLKEKNAKITLVFLTDGAGQTNQQKTIKTRSLEAQKVALELNAELFEIGIPNDTMQINKNHLDELLNILNSKKWTKIFSVFPIDNPPKHRICAYLLSKTIQKIINPNFSIYLYSVHTELIPNKYIDISTVIDEKVQLIEIYESQIQSQSYQHLALGRDAWSSRFLPVSIEKRYIELFFKVTIDDYFRLLNIFNQVNTNDLFKGNQSCIEAFKLLKKM